MCITIDGEEEEEEGKQAGGKEGEGDGDQDILYTLQSVKQGHQSSDTDGLSGLCVLGQ